MSDFPTKTPFVIIGGGIAGVSCAESLAFLAPETPVLLITASSLVKAVTNIVPLATTLTQFDVEEREASTLTESHPSIRVLKDSVVEVNLSSKSLKTLHGKSISYEKLCVCTGAKPRLIHASNDRVIGIRDTESVENLSRKIAKARRIIVVGNGGIATELVHQVEVVDVVWVIRDKHISATFVDPGAAEFFQDKLLNRETEATSAKSEREKSQQVKRIKYKIAENSEGAAEFFQDNLLNSETESTSAKSEREKSQQVKRIKYKIAENSEGAGGAALGPDWHSAFVIRGSSTSKISRRVTVEYQCEISSIDDSTSIDETAKSPEDDWPIYARLTNGKIVGCDLVISATGVEPNANLPGLENLRNAEDGGFAVDWRMETSEKDVFAAGDVCTADWDIAEHWFQMRLWTQAHQMGRYAAKSMFSTLNNEEFHQDFCFDLFTHVTNFFGYKVVLLGLYNGQKLDRDYEILLRMTRGLEYVKLVLRNGRLQGAVLIGDTDLEEMCENLILNQLDLSVYGNDLLDPNIDIEDYFD